MTRTKCLSAAFLISTAVLALAPKLAASRQDAAIQAPGGSAPTTTVLSDCSALRSPTETEAVPLPTSVSALLKLLDLCRETAQTLIAQGQFGFVFLPAMEGKNVALALENHTDGLAGPEKQRAISAIRRLVIAAWEVDADGDTGNKEKLSASYNLFAAAIADIMSIYGSH